jgi:hypothetical protein
MSTSFTTILQRTVEAVPGAVGAIFAAWDGEAVDHWAARMDRDEILFLAAHYGIVLNHVQSVLHLFHFGEAEEIILHHTHMDLLVRSVSDGYYVVLAVRGQSHLATALREVGAAAIALRREMM